MNAILDRATAHFEQLEKRQIDVPEWGEGEKPLTIFWTALTIAERRKIYKADAKGRNPDGATVCVRALILKCRHADGARMFGEMDEHALTYKVDSAVVARIAAKILEGDEGLDDEAIDDEKNG